ncbi:MAG: hypothetical protein CMK59_06705, partial [Proteobacteria bacterium]|nr:hypothetical protein [Pseudomonadota bacterium]
SLEAGGNDCNDGDEDTYPNAPDEWYDGVDSNCDGADDYDQDGDGYQTIIWNENPTTGGDCQDANPDMYPGAPDEWYDGIDSNCDGADDWDKDGDGSKTKALGRGTDCDDENPLVNTNAVEIVNGLDENCDGLVDNQASGWVSDLMYTGTTSGDKAGWSLTTGDLDQDGFDDIIVGNPGHGTNKGMVSILSGANLPSTGSTISDSYSQILGESTGHQAGYAVGFIENFMGDGTPSLALSAPSYGPSANLTNRGRIYLITGDDAFYSGSLNDAYITISGTTTNFVAQGFSEDLDINGDGLTDILGSYVQGSTQFLWLLYGDEALSGDLTVSEADALFTTGANVTDTSVSNFINSMHRNFPKGGDLDGDGLDDGLYCSGIPNHNYQASEGSVWVLWGDQSSYASGNLQTFGTLQANGNTYGVASVVATGPSNFQTGSACAIGPDWDGDGDDELWVYSAGVQNVGAGVYMIEGGADLADSVYRVENAASYYFSSRSTQRISGIREIGDWDGDGKNDIGVAFQASSETDPGEAWVLSSQMAPGDYKGSDDAAVVNGDIDENQVHFGETFPGRPGDVNNDGLIDWIISDWGHMGSSGGNTDQGAIYINYNAQ